MGLRFRQAGEAARCRAPFRGRGRGRIPSGRPAARLREATRWPIAWWGRHSAPQGRRTPAGCRPPGWPVRRRAFSGTRSERIARVPGRDGRAMDAAVRLGLIHERLVPGQQVRGLFGGGAFQPGERHLVAVDRLHLGADHPAQRVRLRTLPPARRRRRCTLSAEPARDAVRPGLRCADDGPVGRGREAAPGTGPRRCVAGRVPAAVPGPESRKPRRGTSPEAAARYPPRRAGVPSRRRPFPPGRGAVCRWRTARPPVPERSPVRGGRGRAGGPADRGRGDVALPGEAGGRRAAGAGYRPGRSSALACVVSKVTVREKSCRWAPDASAASSRLAARSRRVSASAEARACSENGGAAGSGASRGISAKPRLNTRNAVKVSRAYRK